MIGAVISVLSLPLSERPAAFLLIAHSLSDPVYWWTAGHCWNYITVYPCAREWLNILESPRTQRDMFAITEDDRQYWRSLPDDLTAYRAYGVQNRYGVYMTLSLEAAMKLGYRWHGANGRIDTFHVRKQDCLYRGGPQQEVIHLPRYRACIQNCIQ